MSLFEAQSREFQMRHIGPDEKDTVEMLKTIGVKDIEELIDRTVPRSIRLKKDLALPPALCDFGLVGGILRVPGGVFKNVS